jgi:hypothetical protein
MAKKRKIDRSNKKMRRKSKRKNIEEIDQKDVNEEKAWNRRKSKKKMLK